VEATVLREGQWTGELLHSCRDGTVIRVTSRWALDLHEFDGLPAILELNTDVTERQARREAEHRYLEAQLEGILLAGRELSHLLNNHLVLPVGVLDMCQSHPDFPESLRELAEDARRDLAAASEYIAQFHQVVRVE